MNMASVRKKGLYVEDDRVEEFLVNQMAKFIRQRFEDKRTRVGNHHGAELPQPA